MFLYRTWHVLAKYLKMDIRQGKNTFVGIFQSSTTDTINTDHALTGMLQAKETYRPVQNREQASKMPLALRSKC